MPKTYLPILIRPEAPAKPAVGAPCNGCGVCCLLEPCPLGMLLSRRRHGACVALRWSDAHHQYRCGALSAPQDVLPGLLPRPFKSLAPVLSKSLGVVAGRWIAAGQGCDSSVELDEPPEGL